MRNIHWRDFCPCSRPAVGYSNGSPVCEFCQQIERQLVMEDMLKQASQTEEESRLRKERYEEDRWAMSRPKPEPVECPMDAFALIQGFGNYALRAA